MLAYLIRRVLSRAWMDFNITVEEGLHQLQTLCAMRLEIQDGGNCLRIPTPNKTSQSMLDALKIRLPEALPHLATPVVTRKKLPERRKNA